MFRSKTLPLVFPQYEHARLAATIAFNWGNERFLEPKIPKNSFVTGVAFHDRGYPRLDNFPINELEEQDWLKILERGAEQKFQDSLTEIVILKQIARVLSYRNTEGRDDLAEDLRKRIAFLIEESEYSSSQFDFADRITAFADSLSYHYCLGDRQSFTLSVFDSPESQLNNQTVELKVNISSDNQISVSPWPFSQPEARTFLVSYKADNYPEEIEPELQFLTFRQS